MEDKKMSKNFKRFVTLLLTAAMIVGSSMAAFAADGDVTVTGNYYTEPINVTVPTTAVFHLNPGKMEISANGAVPSGARELAIVSVPGEVSNNSAMNLKSSVAIQTTAKGLELQKDAVENTAKDKLASIQFGVASVSGDAAKGDNVFKKSAWNLVDETDEENRPQFILTKKSDSSFNKVYFAFTGTCTPEPTEAWKEGDGVSVKLKFTFAPCDTTITENLPATFNATT
jgi:hypothetical protein